MSSNDGMPDSQIRSGRLAGFSRTCRYNPTMGRTVTRIIVSLLLACACVLGTSSIAVRCAPVPLKHWGLRENEEPRTAYAWHGNLAFDRISQSRSAVNWPAERDLAQMRLRTLPQWTSDYRALRTHDRIDHVAVGWPLRSFYGLCETVQPPNSQTPPSCTWRSALVLKQAGAAPSPDDRVMPLSIRWGALLGNIVIWAVAFWAVAVVAAHVRRALRRARGRCPACGYDLRHALELGCPECGWNRPGDERAPSLV